jgi:hypothetical protein
MMVKRYWASLTLILFLCVVHGAAFAQQATGPLRVHPTNQRYFTDGTGKAIYLTGSHTWTNLVDRGAVYPPPAFDYTGYLNLMQQQGHNFMRMWAWENSRTMADNYTEHYDPHPYRRTGPGNAEDELLKFNLGQFDDDPRDADAYFSRLRARVEAAGQRGIYVSVMLFQGWSVWNYDFGNNRDAWSTSYFAEGNNTSGINADLNHNGEGDEVHSLALTAVTDYQKAYIAKVIDTLNQFDNVLYEISNESHLSSASWQYEMMDFIMAYQKTKAKQHPVGMTAFGDSNDNSALYSLPPPSNRLSPANWISPHAAGFDQPAATYAGTIPAAADDSKVIVLDTDHIGWNIFINDAAYTRSWVWRAFLAGHNPILMEDLSASAGWIAGRAAMGHTRSYANRLNLAAMSPRADLSSTGHCLANPGSEYLTYQPGPGMLRLTLAAGAYSVEWFNTVTGTFQSAPAVKGNGRALNFKAPFANAVLYLKRQL